MVSQYTYHWTLPNVYCCNMNSFITVQSVSSTNGPKFEAQFRFWYERAYACKFSVVQCIDLVKSVLASLSVCHRNQFCNKTLETKTVRLWTESEFFHDNSKCNRDMMSIFQRWEKQKLGVEKWRARKLKVAMLTAESFNLLFEVRF